MAASPRAAALALAHSGNLFHTDAPPEKPAPKSSSPSVRAVALAKANEPESLAAKNAAVQRKADTNALLVQPRTTAKASGQKQDLVGPSPGPHGRDLANEGALQAHEMGFIPDAAYKPLSQTLQKVGQEAIGIGPGTVEMLNAARHHPIREAKVVGKATVHSFGETIHHPIRQFQQDPLGLITNLFGAAAIPGSIAGRIAGVADASTVADAVKAAVKSPKPVERTLRVTKPGSAETVEVHPLGSKNLTVGWLVQKHVIDPLTQHLLDTGKDVPGTLRGKAVHAVVGANVKVGREMRAEERFRTAAQQGEISKLGKYGATRSARIFGKSFRKDAGAVKRALGSKKLSAGEQKAVQIISSGLGHETHQALEDRAVLEGAGNTRAHLLQQGLTKVAEQHMDSPRVTEAADAARAAIEQREGIKGYSEDEILHRLGAHATQISHLAEHGFDSETPVEELGRLEHETADVKPQGETERGDLEQKLAANAAAQHAGPYTEAQRGTIRSQLAENLRKQLEPFTKTHLAMLRRDENMYREQLGEHGSSGAGLAQLRREESQIRDRIGNLDKLDRIEQLHTHLITEGAKARENGGFYLPVQDDLRRVTRGGYSGARASVGTYGIGPGKTEAIHHYGGAKVRLGDYRTDATNLAARSLKTALKEASAKRVHASLWKQASKDPADVPEAYRIPIRFSTTTPDALKKMMNAVDRGDIHAREVDGEPLLAQLVHSWFDPAQFKPGDKVRWIDSRRVGPLAPYVPKWGTTGELLDRLNQIPRFGRFLRPGYLQWLPQNLVVNLVQQGPLIIRNLHSLVREVSKLDPETYEKIAQLAGTGVSHALEGDSQFLQGTMSKAASGWAKIVDHVPRMLAWLHEAHRAGFTSAEDLHRLVNDPALESKMIEVSKRANKEAIDYGAMTNAERATVKKLFTSWPWLSAASRWAARLPVEHPYQSLLYGQAGKKGAADVRAFYEKLGGFVPAWLESSLPTKHGALDTSFLNPAETLGSAAEDVSGMLPYPSHYRGQFAGEFASVPTFLIDTALGVTKYGGTDKAGTAPWQQLIKAFQPAAAMELINKGNSGATAGGPLAAIERYSGSPISGVNYTKAAQSGLSDLTEKGSGYDVAAQKIERWLLGVQTELKQGKITAADAASQTAQAHRTLTFLDRVADIKQGASTTQLSAQQIHDLYVAEAGFDNWPLQTLNDVLGQHGYAPVAQSTLDDEEKRYG